MMLRPATPLTVFFLAAFVLLLISTISTPIVKSIPLGSYRGYNFGVFGYCSPNGCSKKEIGYSTDNLWGNGQNGDFALPPSSRHSLSGVLVVHPIAAFMTLICTLLAAASHFHSPSHSPRYLLALLIFGFPTLLVTLLAFLVDILLFIPHMQWAGWIVLAATIIIMACSLLTCAMRRTLVSRKARKQRIAENAEMSGENYHKARQEEESQFPRVDSPPPLDKTGLHQNKLPKFATYTYDRSRPSTDDRVPLTQQVPSTGNSGYASPAKHSSEFGTPLVPLLTGGIAGRVSSSDERRTPISPLEQDLPQASPLRDRPDTQKDFRGPPNGVPPSSRGSHNPYHGRVRGAYPPRGNFPPRGNYPMRGGPPMRGGLPMRGGFPPRVPHGRGSPNGAMRAPPPGWTNNARGWAPIAAGSGAVMAAGTFGQDAPPPGYQSRPFGASAGRGAPYPPQNVYDEYSRDEPPDQVRRQYGQGSMQDRPVAGNPAQEQSKPFYAEAPTPGEFQSAPQLEGRRSGGPPPEPELDRSVSRRDPTSFGFSGREPSPGGRSRSQPPRSSSPPPPLPVGGPIGQAIEMDASPTNNANAAVTEPAMKTPPFQPPLAELGSNSPLPSFRTPVAPASNEPAELPSPIAAEAASHFPIPLMNNDTPTTPPAVMRPSTHGRTSSDVYYEDVAPRFAHDDPRPVPPLPQTQPVPTTSLHNPPSSPLPLSLVPAGYANHHLHPSQQPGATINRTPESSSSVYDDTQLRRGSPAHSEGSNFTSVSQRGVNPHWRPGPGQNAQGVIPHHFGQPALPSAWPTGTEPVDGSSVYSAGPRGQQRWREQENLLAANPDFSLGRGPRGVGRGTNVRGRGGLGNQGLVADSRYPTGPGPGL